MSSFLFLLVAHLQSFVVLINPLLELTHRQRMLKHLYSSDSIYKDYNLVVVGHSLGGGCAQVLSLMLRPSFPSLRCYAFEPPGCIFDDVLCEDAKEWITSVVHHEDVGKCIGLTLYI